MTKFQKVVIVGALLYSGAVHICSLSKDIKQMLDERKITKETAERERIKEIIRSMQ